MTANCAGDVLHRVAAGAYPACKIIAICGPGKRLRHRANMIYHARLPGSAFKLRAY
ncbi:hypothetical protein KCP78_20675 [Salmonella enterica subsp. enterica]|nr:hypothetical protein KCP78_20675 [Salmonella enterica subsp. enterica]